MVIFKFAIRLCFVFWPVIIFRIITAKTIPVQMYKQLFVFSLVIFVVHYFFYKLMGKAIILIPIVVGIIVLIDGLNTNFKSEGSLGFYFFDLPALVITSIYSFGFFINNMLIDKKTQNDNNKDQSNTHN